MQLICLVVQKLIKHSHQIHISEKQSNANGIDADYQPSHQHVYPSIGWANVRPFPDLHLLLLVLKARVAQTPKVCSPVVELFFAAVCCEFVFKTASRHWNTGLRQFMFVYYLSTDYKPCSECTQTPGS